MTAPASSSLLRLVSPEGDDEGREGEDGSEDASARQKRRHPDLTDDVAADKGGVNDPSDPPEKVGQGLACCVQSAMLNTC